MINTNYKEYLKYAKSWREAVSIIVDGKMNNYECFSSGEITKEIRTYRPDLRFSHWDVGQYMRDLYYDGEMIDFDDNMAVQVPRRTQGKSRTPAGIEVFVYGPDYESAQNHDFEVEIPRAQVDMSIPYDEYGTQPNEDSQFSFNDDKVVATVQGDNRLTIPRSAFDSFMLKTGQKIAFGDKIHIKYDPDDMKVKVSLSQIDNSKPYELTRDRGRVKYKPDEDPSWSSGEKFSVKVTNDGLEVDSTEKV
jgi:hypothetical protein